MENIRAEVQIVAEAQQASGKDVQYRFYRIIIRLISLKEPQMIRPGCKTFPFILIREWKLQVAHRLRDASSESFAEHIDLSDHSGSEHSGSGTELHCKPCKLPRHGKRSVTPWCKLTGLRSPARKPRFPGRTEFGPNNHFVGKIDFLK